MNRTAVKVLQEWDPFHLGEDEYETEAADVVAALQVLDDPVEIGNLIQKVYEYSFEEWLPLEECIRMAHKLIAIKSELTCSLS